MPVKSADAAEKGSRKEDAILVPVRHRNDISVASEAGVKGRKRHSVHPCKIKELSTAYSILAVSAARLKALAEETAREGDRVYEQSEETRSIFISIRRG